MVALEYREQLGLKGLLVLKESKEQLVKRVLLVDVVKMARMVLLAQWDLKALEESKG
jgi:hypothetical protein